MGRDPQVWQYGLVAEMWAAGTRETRELEFLRSAIETYGQPVLDPGCGAGRLLIPLCEAGTEIDGADISTDMLASCQARLDRLGLSAELFTGPMQLLELPRKYRVILIADSFGLAGGRAMDGQTRRRAFEHLEPGGVLILNKEAPYALDDWGYWTHEGRKELPGAWPEEPNRRHAEDGSEYLSWVREIALDPLEQSYPLEIRVQKHRAGSLQGEELRTLTGTLYFRNELVAMLGEVGFSGTRVLAGYQNRTASAEDEELVYLAFKQA